MREIRSVLIYVFHKLGPVFDGCGHIPTEYEVELRVVQPWAFDIVDFKFHVWRYPVFSWLAMWCDASCKIRVVVPSRLDRAEVISKDLGNYRHVRIQTS